MRARGQVVIFALIISTITTFALSQSGGGDDGLETGGREFKRKSRESKQATPPINPKTAIPDDPSVALALVPNIKNQPPIPKPYPGQDIPIDPAIRRSLESASNPQDQARLKDLGVDPAALKYRTAILAKINAGNKENFSRAVDAAYHRFPNDPTFQTLHFLTQRRITQAKYDSIVAKTLAEGSKLFGVQVAVGDNLPATQSGKGFNSRTILSKAYGQLNQGDDARAENTLTSAIQRDSSRSSLYDARSLARLRLGDFKEADADSLMAVRLAPEESSVYAHRAEVMRTMGRGSEVLGWLNAALRLNPLDDVALLERGGYFRANHRPDLALADYKRSARIDPRNYDIYRKALNDIPVEDARLYTERGISRAAHADYAGALSDSGRVLANDPNNSEARGLRQLSLLKTGQYGEAIKEATISLKLNPRDSRALIIRGAALQRLGQTARAQEDLRKASEIDPRLGNGTPHP